MSAQTRTARFSNGVYSYISEPGAYSFATLTIREHATVHLQASNALVQIGTLEVHYGGKLFAERLAILGNDIILQPGATISLDGGGYASELGPGAGSKVSDSGSGAGHGAPGGSPLLQESGGFAYGLMRQPMEHGSGGGSSNSGAGGAGGGFLNVTLSRLLLLEGQITADGARGQAENSGGGSGGAMVVTTPEFNGHGTMSVNGGVGNDLGGGGAGGRIKLEIGQRALPVKSLYKDLP